MLANPEPSKTPKPGAIKIDTSNTVDRSTGEGSRLSWQTDDMTAAATPAVAPDTQLNAASTMPSAQAETAEPASSLTGQTISQATSEASKPKPPRPVVIPSQRQQAPSQTTIKPGETWNINDVPDPTPNLGSLISQLFVPETNFSGAISI